MADQSALFLFKDESDSKSSTSAASSALDLKDISLHTLSSDITHIIDIDSNTLDVVDHYLDAENDDGHTEYKYKLVNPTPDRIIHLVTQMNYRLTEGHGTAYYMIGVQDDGHPTGLSDQELRDTVHTIQIMAMELRCQLFLVYLKKGSHGKIARIMLKRSSQDAEHVPDVRICIVGDADSGKSTLLGVLTTGKMDNAMVKRYCIFLRSIFLIFNREVLE